MAKGRKPARAVASAAAPVVTESRTKKVFEDGIVTTGSVQKAATAAVLDGLDGTLKTAGSHLALRGLGVHLRAADKQVRDTGVAAVDANGVVYVDAEKSGPLGQKLKADQAARADKIVLLEKELAELKGA